MQLGRVCAYVDGFNLYHAIKRLRSPHYLWLDLRQLCGRFVQPRTDTLLDVKYFSAYAEWMPAQAQRHRAYVSALEATGVLPIMGKFKEKDRRCNACGHSYKGHEEKETDINIALHLLADADDDRYDTAFIVSRDSDLVPAMRMIRERRPRKKLILVAPPKLGHGHEMLQLSDGKRKVTEAHLRACQLPERTTLANGSNVERPSRYAPPT